MANSRHLEIGFRAAATIDARQIELAFGSLRRLHEALVDTQVPSGWGVHATRLRVGSVRTGSFDLGLEVLTKPGVLPDLINGAQHIWAPLLAPSAAGLAAFVAVMQGVKAWHDAENAALAKDTEREHLKGAVLDNQKRALEVETLELNRQKAALEVRAEAIDLQQKKLHAADSLVPVLLAAELVSAKEARDVLRLLHIPRNEEKLSRQQIEVLRLVGQTVLHRLGASADATEFGRFIVEQLAVLHSLSDLIVIRVEEAA